MPPRIKRLDHEAHLFQRSNNQHDDDDHTYPEQDT
jgi:hypothetical protein